MDRSLLAKKNIMRYFLFLGLFLLGSCSNAALESELTTTKTALAKAETALNTANQQLANLQHTGQLVHVVFFKVKAGKEAEMITEVKKLKAIPVIKDLEVGTFENLDDPRALSDYNLVMEIVLENKEAYEIYQTHPIHLTLKENAKSLVTGPPATYDFIEQ